MRTGFVLFGRAHLLILASLPAMAALLAWLVRRHPARARRVRLCLGVFLIANELVWQAYRLRVEGFRFPEGLPLQLCDLALWLTVVALLTLKPWSCEAAYLIGLSGSGMALLTPDLWAPFWSYPTAYFFLAHGGVVVSVLYLCWAASLRLRSGSLWRVLAAANLYAAGVGVFNALFHTNYMYLCRKPAGASLLDYLGPWPLYIFAGEVVALGVFVLLWLPFQLSGKRRAVQ